MLDYAANATAFWRVELLQSWFEDECQRLGVDAPSALKAAFGVDNPERYWATVQTNLAADRIRLVFVADQISSELRSIVEFLNRQLRETEVLAIEVKQYVDATGGLQTIVPRVVGRTEAARAAKGPSGRSSANAFDLLSAPEEARSLIERMDTVAAELGLVVKPAATGRNYQPAEIEPGASYATGIGVYATGRGAEFNLQVFRELGAEDVADKLLERLRTVTGVNVTARSAPAVPCESLVRVWERARTDLIEPYFRARDQLQKQPRQ
jgi:hypothetical protein